MEAVDKKRTDLQQAQVAIGRLKQQTEESDRLRQREADALEALRKDAERQVTNTTITTTMIMTDDQPLVVYNPNPCSNGLSVTITPLPTINSQLI